MSLGSGIIPWVRCPSCGETGLAISPCRACGLSHWEADLISKGIGPHVFEPDGGDFDYCCVCGKIESLPYHVQE